MASDGRGWWCGGRADVEGVAAACVADEEAVE
jgi:hypothetical protein